MTAPALESVSFELGAKFGRWVVIGPVRKGRRYQAYAKCRCECGRERDVWCPDLRTGGSTQCRSCAIAMRSTKHGHAKRAVRSPEYTCWRHMIERCLSPACHEWPDYGGRGIGVVAEWTGDGGFERFLAHMGPRPSMGHSIDRIDGNRGYGPGNVRWADRFTQAQNRSIAVLVTHEGRTACVAEWARIKCINASTLSWRIRQGWPAERALTP